MPKQNDDGNKYVCVSGTLRPPRLKKISKNASKENKK